VTENNQKQKNKTRGKERKESVLYPIPIDRFKDDRSFVAIASSRQTARMTHSDSQRPAPAPPPVPCIVYGLCRMSWGRYAVYNSSKERTPIQSVIVSVSVGSSPLQRPVSRHTTQRQRHTPGYTHPTLPVLEYDELGTWPMHGRENENGCGP